MVTIKNTNPVAPIMKTLIHFIRAMKEIGRKKMYRENVMKTTIRMVFSMKKGNPLVLSQTGYSIMTVMMAVMIHQSSSATNFCLRMVDIGV